MARLLAELPGRIWAGKEALLQAVGALAHHCATAFPATFTEPQAQPEAEASAEMISQQQVLEALLAALRRRNVAFAEAAAEALTQALQGFGDGAHLSTVCEAMRLAKIDTDAAARGGVPTTCHMCFLALRKVHLHSICQWTFCMFNLSQWTFCTFIVSH